MAVRKSAGKVSGTEDIKKALAAEQVATVDLPSEVADAFGQFGAYANYRSVPSVLDGLKPGARRMLWAMYTNGYLPNRKTVKAASAIGDTMKYHPHGDMAQYQTMVTMCHVPEDGPSVRRLVPYLYGQGNWGDLDDGAAASRYTECKLNETAMTLLGSAPDVNGGSNEIEENGVELEPNYSGDLKEPVLLPAMWPAFAVNGSEGIGVGTRTYAPSHNLAEVMSLAAYMVDQPNPRIDTVRKHILGPDLPCEADIYDTPAGGINSYLETGEGTFVTKARFTVEEYADGKKTGSRMVITGLPFLSSPAKVTAGIAELIDKERIPKDIEVYNYTAGEGINLVIDLKGHNATDMVNRLMYHGETAELRKRFSVQSRAVVDGFVRTVGTVEAIGLWLDHRRVVIRRRSRYRLEKAQDRLELVDGFLALVPIAEKVVALIRASDDRAQAHEGLVNQFNFSKRQAGAILDLSISRLSKMGTAEYTKEKADLEATIATCQGILGNPKTLNEVLKAEIRVVAKKHKAPRRCTMMEGDDAVSRPTTPAQIAPAVPGNLVITGKKWLRWATAAGRINRVVGTDYAVASYKITDQDSIEGVSNLGIQHRIPASSLPSVMTNSEAVFPGLQKGESLIGVNSGTALGQPDMLLVVQAPKGWAGVKKVSYEDWTAPSRGGKPRPVVGLEPGHEVTMVDFVQPDSHTLLASISSSGMLLLTDLHSVLTKGRSAKGLPMMKLGATERIIWSGVVAQDDQIVYWTDKGAAGRLSLSQVSPLGRTSKGRKMTGSKAIVEGALVVPRGKSSVRLFDGSMEEPTVVEVSSLPEGITLSDRQLNTAVIPRITKANAVWVE